MTVEISTSQYTSPITKKKIKIKKKTTNKITDDEIVLFDFDFACNVTWYGLSTEKRQDKRKKEIISMNYFK